LRPVGSGLQRREEALHRGVVSGIARAAHRADDALISDQSLKLARSCISLPRSEGCSSASGLPHQGIGDELLEPARSRPDISEVSNPFAVGSRRASKMRSNTHWERRRSQACFESLPPHQPLDPEQPARPPPLVSPGDAQSPSAPASSGRGQERHVADRPANFFTQSPNCDVCTPRSCEDAHRTRLDP
jgi:hypothetical protein